MENQDSNDSMWIYVGVFIILSGVSILFMGSSMSLFNFEVTFWLGLGFILFGIFYFVYYLYLGNEKPFR